MQEHRNNVHKREKNLIYYKQIASWQVISPREQSSKENLKYEDKMKVEKGDSNAISFVFLLFLLLLPVASSVLKTAILLPLEYLGYENVQFCLVHM